MSTKPKSRFWRLLTIYLRRFRIVVLFVSFLLLGIFFYLNQIGLPDFAKRPLLASLRERGVDLEFERMRLRWQQGIVADNVRFGATEEPNAPKMFAREVQIKIQRGSLLHGKVDVDGLLVRDGKIEWPEGKTNAPLRALNVTDIQTRLRLLPGDQWTLDDFRAKFGGAQFHVSASITNASALRDLEIFRGGPTDTNAPSRWPARLRLLADTLDAVKFTVPPDFNLDVEGDAKRMDSFALKFTVLGAGANSPWGEWVDMLYTARLFPAGSNELTHAEFQVEARALKTPWATLTNLNAHLNVISLAPQPELASVSLTLHAGTVQTPWADARGVILNADWIHAITNPVPLSARVNLGASTVSTRWAGGDGVHLEATLERLANAPEADPALGFWTNFFAYRATCDFSAMKFRSEKISADSTRLICGWDAPVLTVSNLQAGLARGPLKLESQLNVRSREVTFTLDSRFDAKQLLPLLNDHARQWLNRLDWNQPPIITGTGAVTLPEWANPAPDWEEVLSRTLRLAGEFALTNGAYRGVHADWAHSHLSYTNFVWRLPDLQAASEMGRVDLEHWTDDSTQDYYWRIRSSLHPDALIPVLTEKQRRGFVFVKFGLAPFVDGELWGRWRDDSRIGFQAQVAVTNISVRSETFDWTVAKLRFTNSQLHVESPRISQGEQRASADGLLVDLVADRLYFTNADTTFAPFVVTRAIGPITHRTVQPYVFVNPPRTHVEGFISLAGADDVDMRFDVDGGPFEWWRFHVPNIRGRVLWKGDSLTLTNMEMVFYEGWANGHAHFDLGADVGTQFAFTLNTTNANLHLLIGDMYSPTNSLEGQLSGSLVVTNANSDLENSWNGFGHAQLRDGLIWAIPVFGALSKPLDNIVPGLGTSRITEGQANFIITNSVVHSSDLVMRTPASRLQYVGSVDFSGKLDARVEAELFRDTWLIGRMVSIVLWPVTKMFEFNVTGHLNEPKLEPRFIPKFMTAPLHPIRSLEELLPPPVTETNAPPQIPTAPK